LNAFSEKDDEIAKLKKQNQWYEESLSKYRKDWKAERRQAQRDKDDEIEMLEDFKSEEVLNQLTAKL
jgi:hypothetical protein